MADKPQQPPTIDLGGACLRPLRAADAGALYAYLRDPAVTERTAYPVVSMPLVEAMIERSRSRWAAGELSRWGVALQPDDQLVGTCGFNEHSQAHRWAELAYDLAQAHWGKGLMRQAVAAVLEWTFRQGLVERVHAFVRVDNSRSQRLLERSGFVREGCLRSYRVCRGQPHDFHVYALLRSDWAAAQKLLASDQDGIDHLRKVGRLAPDQATTLAFAFLRESSANGRHVWGDFRARVLQALADLIGRASVEDRLSSEWSSFMEESRLDLVYDMLGDPMVLSTSMAERLFFHPATTRQCKGNVLDGLLQSRERRNLDERYFFGLLDKLASQATPANRDEVEVSCIEMHDLIRAHLGQPKE